MSRNAVDGQNHSWLGRCAPLAVCAFFALALPADHAGAQARERSGKEVVDAVCAKCHATGALGAPKIGDERAWIPLASRGLSGLSESALKGIRNMPSHGGDQALSDIEIERAITYMVNQSGGRWAEPISGLTPAVERRGEYIVKIQCSKCHRAGLNGAPKIGDRSAWIPRLKSGLDALVRSAIHGHGPMPARGGMADLSDSEMRAAIVYMFNPQHVAATGGSVPATTWSLPNRKFVDGMEVDMGIVSAESILAKYPKGSKESAMHGGVPSGRGYYHLNISLFDRNTKTAITNAKVEATVREPTGAETKELDLVTIANIRSYGNYFRMTSKNPYTITVRIRRPGVARTVEARFDFRR